MRDKSLIFPEYVNDKLEEATLDAIATCLLLKNSVEPVLGDFACEGLLEAHSDGTDEGKNAFAREWMEKNFDALYASFNAASALSSRAADILQLLPRPQIIDTSSLEKIRGETSSGQTRS